MTMSACRIMAAQKAGKSAALPDSQAIPPCLFSSHPQPKIALFPAVSKPWRLRRHLARFLIIR
jgi:hypothetical protein